MEKGHPAKAYFPDVYREFEDLHNMVKKMAYDHLSNSDSVNCQQPVEIKDAKVINYSVWNYNWLFVCLLYFRCLAFFIFSDKLSCTGKFI